MKILFYALDGAAAKARGIALRAEGDKVIVADVYACRQAEAADAIEFMPDVPEFERSRIFALFGADAPIESDPTDEDPADKKAPKKPVDPFAELVDGWQEFQARKLIRIAAAITGRTAADKAEATAMIDQALADRVGAAVPPPPPPA